MSEQYPRGKLREDDEGVLPMKIDTRDKTIVLSFGQLVSWIGLSADDALSLAVILVERAAAIKEGAS